MTETEKDFFDLINDKQQWMDHGWIKNREDSSHTNLKDFPV